VFTRIAHLERETVDQRFFGDTPIEGQMNGSPSKFTAIHWMYSCPFIGCIAQKTLLWIIAPVICLLNHGGLVNLQHFDLKKNLPLFLQLHIISCILH
jgi:hypothetical protein